MSGSSGNLLKRSGELDELGGIQDIPEEEDHGSHFVGRDESFDILTCFMAMESDDKELLPVSVVKEIIKKKLLVPCGCSSMLYM